MNGDWPTRTTELQPHALQCAAPTRRSAMRPLPSPRGRRGAAGALDRGCGRDRGHERGVSLCLHGEPEQPSGQTVTVDFETANGTRWREPIHGADHADADLQSRGDREAGLGAGLGDTVYETNETFSVTLSNASSGATIADGAAPAPSATMTSTSGHGAAPPGRRGRGSESALTVSGTACGAVRRQCLAVRGRCGHELCVVRGTLSWGWARR